MNKSSCFSNGRRFRILLTLPVFTYAAAPVVSNVSSHVTAIEKLNTDFRTWTVETTFDLEDSDNDSCYVWAGLKTGEQEYFLPTRPPGSDSGLPVIRVAPGQDHRMSFAVTDTGVWRDCRVKVTAWDGAGWPPWPPQPFFARHHHWTMDVRDCAVHPESESYIAFQKNANWRKDMEFIPDHPIFRVVGNHPAKQPFSIEYEDESDNVAIPFPHTSLGDPADAFPEEGGDSHIHIIDVENWLLYEIYGAEPAGNGPQDWTVWQSSFFDLKAQSYAWIIEDSESPYAGYRPGCRVNCTSADAAGLAMVPGLLAMQEIIDGEVNHALRYTTESTGGFVYPAHHREGDNSEPYATPMGLHLRLRASFDIDQMVPEDGSDATRAARIVLRALKKYGMICADGGANLFFMSEHDGYAETKWDGITGGKGETFLRDALHDAGLSGSAILDRFEVLDWRDNFAAYLEYESNKQ
jgi:hypothetical protein